MSQILELVAMIVTLLFNALVAYDETPEGKAEIDALLTLVEQAGFDIPGWQPEQGQQPLNFNQAEAVAVENGVDEIVKRWLQRHPQSGGG